MLNFGDFIQVYVFTTNHHLKVAFFGFSVLTKMTQHRKPLMAINSYTEYG